MFKTISTCLVLIWLTGCDSGELVQTETSGDQQPGSGNNQQSVVDTGQQQPTAADNNPTIAPVPDNSQPPATDADNSQLQTNNTQSNTLAPVDLSANGFEGRDPAFDGTALVIPGQIEAENVIAGTGSLQMFEASRYEAGAGQIVRTNVSDSSATYLVDAQHSGLYELKIRYAHAGVGGTVTLDLYSDSSPLASVELPATGGDNLYQTVTISDLALTEGEQSLTASVTGGDSFNLSLNWLAFRATPDASSPEYEFYVSVTGDDANNGSQVQPFQTFRRAIDELSKINNINPSHGPINIWLRDGYHEISSTISLDSSHTGTPSGPVTIRSFPNETAILGGGRQIPLAGFSLVESNDPDNGFLHPQAQGNVYRISLDDADWRARFPGGFHLGMISYDSSKLQLASFPNKGLFTATNGTQTSFQTLPSLNGVLWQNELERNQISNNNIMIVLGHMQSDEFEERSSIVNATTDGTLTLADSFAKLPNNNRTARAVNVLAELDIPGEWYYDRDTNQLYLWPVAALSLLPDIRVGMNEPLLNGSGIDYWTVRDLKIQDVSGTTDFNGASDMINIRGNHHTWGGNDIRNGNSRVGLRINGRFNRITGNNFYDLAAPYVIAGGTRSFPIVPSQSEFTNNRVFNLTNRGYGGGGITGAGIRFANNLMNEIQAGNTYTGSPDTLIELNEWYDVGYELGDWNVAYSGASYSNVGNVSRHNLVHHLIRPNGRRRAGAFRGDDGTSALAFYGNIFYKTGDYAAVLHRLAESFTNNVVVNTNSTGLFVIRDGLIGDIVDTPDKILEEEALQQAVTADTPRNKDNLLFNAEQVLGEGYWDTPYFTYKYPLLDRSYDINRYYGTNIEFKRNYAQNVPRLANFGPGAPNDSAHLSETLNYLNNEIPGREGGGEAPVELPDGIFRDPMVLDLRFAESFTPLAGFDPIPFEKIGLFEDEFRQSVPHPPTYRANSRLRWEGVASSGATYGNEVYPDPNFNRRVSFDVGSYTSPLHPLATLLTANTQGSYGWVETTGLISRLSSADNAYNQDGVMGKQATVFEHAVENGTWYVQVTFGDTIALDEMSLSVEGNNQVHGVSTEAGEYRNVYASSLVVDGRLSIEFSHSGSLGTGWAVTRIVVQNTPFTENSKQGLITALVRNKNTASAIDD